MAGSNLISALNAQRAPHGGRWGIGGVDDDRTSQRLSSGKKKKLLPALPFKYDSSFSASHRSFCRIDLHWWFLCFPLCLAQCDLWLIQAHTKTKGTRPQMRYRFFFANVQRASHGSSLLYSTPICACLFFSFSFSFCERNTDHRRWPSQGLENERINSNTLTSRLADGD